MIKGIVTLVVVAVATNVILDQLHKRGITARHYTVVFF